MAGSNPDELDDGLEYSYESDNVSGGEEVEVSNEGSIDNKEEDSEDSKKEENEQDSEDSKKEETEQDSDLKKGENGQNGQNSEDSNKKRKRKNEKLVDKKKQKMAFDVDQKLKISTQSPERIADFFASKVRAENPDLSALELGELYVPRNAIKYTGFWEKKRNLDGLQEFLEANFKKYIPEKAGKPKNSKKKNKLQRPDEEERKFILILSMSALRVCDVHRATKGISNSSIKLISKNKLKDDLKILKTTRSRILAATPLRIIKLLNDENATLKLSEIKNIIVDSSYLDPKKRCIWDTEDITAQLKSLIKEGAKIHLY